MRTTRINARSSCGRPIAGPNPPAEMCLNRRYWTHPASFMSRLLICFLIGCSCRNSSSPVYLLSFLKGHDLRIPRSIRGRPAKLMESSSGWAGRDIESEATGTDSNVTVEVPLGGGRMGTAWLCCRRQIGHKTGLSCGHQRACSRTDGGSLGFMQAIAASSSELSRGCWWGCHLQPRNAGNQPVAENSM
jgi:hypothetical protein